MIKNELNSEPQPESQNAQRPIRTHSPVISMSEGSQKTPERSRDEEADESERPDERKSSISSEEETPDQAQPSLTSLANSGDQSRRQDQPQDRTRQGARSRGLRRGHTFGTHPIGEMYNADPVGFTAWLGESNQRREESIRRGKAAKSSSPAEAARESAPATEAKDSRSSSGQLRRSGRLQKLQDATTGTSSPPSQEKKRRSDAGLAASDSENDTPLKKRPTPRRVGSTTNSEEVSPTDPPTPAPSGSPMSISPTDGSNADAARPSKKAKGKQRLQDAAATSGPSSRPDLQTTELPLDHNTPPHRGTKQITRHIAKLCKKIRKKMAGSTGLPSAEVRDWLGRKCMKTFTSSGFFRSPTSSKEKLPKIWEYFMDIRLFCPQDWRNLATANVKAGKPFPRKCAVKSVTAETSSVGTRRNDGAVMPDSSTRVTTQTDAWNLPGPSTMQEHQESSADEDDPESSDDSGSDEDAETAYELLQRAFPEGEDGLDDGAEADPALRAALRESVKTATAEDEKRNGKLDEENIDVGPSTRPTSDRSPPSLDNEAALSELARETQQAIQDSIHRPEGADRASVVSNPSAEPSRRQQSANEDSAKQTDDADDQIAGNPNTENDPLGEDDFDSDKEEFDESDGDEELRQKSKNASLDIAEIIE
ncbi:hypothetical protein HII31_05010 [Pseudocercospora fuligena]|uniref:Uncharacterized protein n=1 Tax=Pseudocercospora fuligena TaxID=685502 RepID=A0A8H6VMK9_9PEZI|nr:hypothetical protein HII31_05010 [Pseudocercospora fuligena]